MVRYFWLCLLMLAGVCVTVPGHVAIAENSSGPDTSEPTAPDYTVFDGIPAPILMWLYGDVEEAAWVEKLARYSQYLDRNGDGLDKADIDTADDIAIAGLRAMGLTQLMAADINGDGFATGEEAKRVARHQNPSNGKQDSKYRARLIYQAYYSVLRFDADGDGKVSVAEYFERTRHYVYPGENAHYRAMLDIDPNGDGHLTAAEVEEIGHRAFRAADTNQNGKVDAEDLSDVNGVRKLAQEDMAIGPCRMTKPGDGDLLVHLHAYSAPLQPDITVAGQYGETKLARVEIEPGDQPIWLVTSSYDPTIWQFEGATDRIAHVTVSPGYMVRDGSDGPGGGVIGVDAKRVEILRAASCLISNEIDAAPEAKKAGTLAVQRAFLRGAGRLPDASINSHDYELVKVPSGTTVAHEPQNRRYTQDEGQPGIRLLQDEEFHGDASQMVSINPDDVVAPGPVERYEVLPAYYGLRQLVEEGKLARTDEGYKILKPITRFPAHVTGTFILSDGVELPSGLWMYPTIVPERID